MQTLPPDLHNLAPYIHAIAPYLHQYGYWAILFGVMLEDFGLPVPGETLLITGSIFAALGDFQVVWVAIVGFAGAVIGDNIGYAIGYFGGQRLVRKIGKYVMLTEERLQQLEDFFDRHGGIIVIAARFIEGLRQFNGIIAGTSRMRWGLFLIFNMIGAAIWVAFWVSVAYLFGSKLGIIFEFFKRFEVYFLIGIGVLIVIYIAWRVFKKRRGNKKK
ncbi:MAG: DedA family protein [Calditrichia bacterium]